MPNRLKQTTSKKSNICPLEIIENSFSDNTAKNQRTVNSCAQQPGINLTDLRFKD